MEITAIPELLELLAIKGCIVTIDAMGCQKKSTVKAIKDKGADYVLMVKGNQKELKDQVEKLFSIALVKAEFSRNDLGHGRIEQRKCEVIDQLKFMDDKQDWADLKTVVRITSERTIKQTGKGNAVRSQWAVENNLHWSLDVVFKKDASLKKKDHSALNYNVIAKNGHDINRSGEVNKKK